MSQILTIALNTFRENRRDRVLYVFVFFAAVMILAGVVVGELSPFEQAKVLLDLGQSAMSLVGSLIAIFLGIGLVSREIDRRTIYVIIAKPVTRTEFLFGKVAGLALTLTAVLALMSAIFLIVAVGYGVKPTLALGQSVVLLWVELVLLVAVAVTFASFTSTTMLSAMFSVGVWIIGQVVGDLARLAERSESVLTKTVLGFFYWLLPNLSLFDAKARATYGIPVPAGEMAAAIVYGLAYSAALLCVASIVFSRRDFK